MSKGGAGKVYFILYLAVLLELLIIIVERDEAELNLKKEKKALEERNKQIQLIAETIINSMRGSATSVSSTSDQSMILGDEKEADGREFSVRVRVADPLRDSVKQLDLHLLRNEQEVKVINIALDSTLYPRVKAGQDYIFKYKFKPEYGEGQYKLRFDAKTNQIVGVTQDASPDDTVKIGAVKLTVKQLRDVRDGIQENIGLRGYIDSLLTGQYENFTSNIGSNEFIVNVKKKAATVIDQLAIFPQENDFASFPGLELPNPVKIEGAEAKGVKVEKLEGPGNIVRIDTNWVWIWQPSAADAGQTYTVRIKGNASRNGGEKDVASNTFSVSVKPLAPVGTMYMPTTKGSPFAGIPFKVNGKHADLNGQYKVQIFLDGQLVQESNEPTAEWKPTLLQDEKKKLQVKVLFKGTYARDYSVLKDTTFTINAPPLTAAPSVADLTVGDAMEFKAALGVAPKSGITQGNYIEPGGDLEISSPYFEKTAKKIKQFDFVVKMTSKAASEIKDRNGKLVSITVSDPRTGASTDMEVQIMPKQQQKPGSGRSKM